MCVPHSSVKTEVYQTKFRRHRTSHMEPSATSTTVTGPVGDRLQAGTENAPVLDRRRH